MYLSSSQNTAVETQAPLAFPSGEAHQNNLNLNYGARNCHEAAETPDTDAPQKRLRPWPFGNERIDPNRLHSKKDWIRSELSEKYPATKNWLTQGKKGAGIISEAFKESISQIEGIHNTDLSRRLDEFLSCGGRKSWATLVRYKDGDQRLKLFSCGETACPSCYDRGKRRVHQDIHGYIMGAARALKIVAFYRQVFTLPESVEGIPTKGSKERKELLEAIRKLQKRLCGLRLRDGLAAYCSVHAIGDNDLFKDRFHFHAGFVPIASVKLKTGETVVEHCDPEWIPHELIKAEWLKILRRVFPEHDLDVAVVHLAKERFDNPRISTILDHHLSYDGRGFGKTFLKAPLAFDPVTSRVVIEAEQGGYLVTTMEQLARRWKWVRGQRDYRTWGILSQRKKYAPIIGVEHVVEPEPEIETEERVTVVREFGKVWDKRKGIVWVDEKRAYFKGKEIVGVEWGRKGGSEWRLISAAPPG